MGYKIDNVKLAFDSEEFEMVRAAPSDPYEAGRCLEFFAKRLRDNFVEGDVLAKHVINAFEAAAKAKASVRAKVLTDALYLTTRRKRPAADYLQIGREMESLLSEGKSETAAKKMLEEKLGTSSRTILRRFREYSAAKEAHDKVCWD